MPSGHPAMPPMQQHPAAGAAPVVLPIIHSRLCDYCGKIETQATGRILAVCAGCKFTQYCSKQCQREHWQSHRDICRLTAATIGASRDPNAETEHYGAYPTPNLAKRLRVFAGCKQTLIVWTAWQALRDNLSEKCLLIELAYEPKATLKFSFKKAFVMPREYLSQHADPIIVDDVKRRDERCRRAGGVGTALCLLQCQAMAEVMPIELDQPATFAAWEIREDWESIFDFFVSSDRPFAPPLVSGLNIRNHRYAADGRLLH
jgi:hypothetical protein